MYAFGIFCQPAVSCIISSSRWGKIKSETNLMITVEVRLLLELPVRIGKYNIIVLIVCGQRNLDLLKIKLMFCSVPNANQTLQHHTEVHRNVLHI